MKELSNKNKFTQLRPDYRRFFLEPYLEIKDLASFVYVSKDIHNSDIKKENGFCDLPEVRLFKVLNSSIKNIIDGYFSSNEYHALDDDVLRKKYESLLKIMEVDVIFNFSVESYKILLQQLHLSCFLKGSFNKDEPIINHEISKELLLKKITKMGDHHIFKHVPENFKDDKELVLNLLKVDHNIVNFISERLKDDDDVAKIIMDSCCWGFSYLSDRFQSDKYIVLNCMEQHPSSWVYVKKELKRDFLSKAIGLKDNQKLSFMTKDDNFGTINGWIITNTNEDLIESLGDFFYQNKHSDDEEIFWPDECDYIENRDQNLHIKFKYNNRLNQSSLLVPLILRSIKPDIVLKTNDYFRLLCSNKSSSRSEY